MDVRRAIGLNVRRLRLAAGLSQEELGARMGVEQFYVSGIETGDRNPTAVRLWRAASALGVEPGKLFEGATRALGQKRKRIKKKARSGSPTAPKKSLRKRAR